MKRLALALYSEGSTDQRFLPDIIRRTSRKVLERYGQNTINVQPVDLIEFSKLGLKQEDCILRAAQHACDYHALIIHADADHRTSEKALLERFLPGYHRVQIEATVCKHLVPIIPVQMTEAWMLVDHEALQEAIGTSISGQELGLPAKAKQVEADPNPKQTLNLVLQRAHAHRSKRQRSNQLDLKALYSILGRTLSLEQLSNLPAYKQFVQDLIETLKKLDVL